MWLLGALTVLALASLIIVGYYGSQLVRRPRWYEPVLMRRARSS